MDKQSQTNPMTKNYYSFIAILGILISNLYIGHYFAPTGIFMIPAVLIICTAIITLNTDGLNIILKSVCVFCCIVLNDISIKLYAGGRHDLPGLGITHVFTLIGLIPTFWLLVASTFLDKASVKSKIGAVMIFPMLVIIYYHFFWDLGLGRSY